MTTDLVEPNLGLVGAAVKHSRVKLDWLYDWDDAFQDGAAELVRCAERYDPDMGFAFTTYAYRRIRKAVERGRGRFEGLSYRQAQAEGLPWNGPASLDAVYAGAGFESGDMFEPLDPVLVDELVGSVDAVDRFVDEHAGSEQDRRLLLAVAGGMTLSEHAAAEGVSRQAVQQRWKRLVGRVSGSRVANTMLV